MKGSSFFPLQVDSFSEGHILHKKHAGFFLRGARFLGVFFLKTCVVFVQYLSLDTTQKPCRFLEKKPRPQKNLRGFCAKYALLKRGLLSKERMSSLSFGRLNSYYTFPKHLNNTILLHVDLSKYF